MTNISPEIRHAIEQAGDEPARLIDPLTSTTYVLVRADQFEAEHEDIDTLYPLSEEAFGKAGWDDPKMDEYNDYETRRL